MDNAEILHFNFEKYKICMQNSAELYFAKIIMGCFQISGKIFDLSSAIFGFRVIREFLILVFILNLRFRENKENSILCKGGVLEIRAKFTFNFSPKFNLFRKKNLILPCLNQLVGQRLPISSQKDTIFLVFLSVCSEFSKNVMPQISLEFAIKVLVVEPFLTVVRKDEISRTKWQPI